MAELGSSPLGFDGGFQVSACRGKLAQRDLGSGQNLVGHAKVKPAPVSSTRASVVPAVSKP